MDPGVDTSVTVEELASPTDLPAQSHQSPISIPPAGNTINPSEEWHHSDDSNRPDSTGPPQADPLFVPIMDDQMDWRSSAENTHDNNNQPHSPPPDSSDQARTAGSRSDSPQPPRHQENPAGVVHNDEPHAFWAEFEDDLSTPSEAELREIESAQDGDYSAHDYWEQSFYRDLDDPEYRPIQKARLSWKFKGVHGTRDQPNRAKIMRSPPAYVGGYWWTIKFFPRGNNVSSLSIYIECSRKRPSSERALRQGEFIAVQGPSNASLTDCAPDIDLKFSETDNSATWLDNYYEARQFAPTQGTPPSGPWRVSAQIGVALYNPQEPRTGWTQSSCHQFNPQNADWGWTNFHGPWDSVHRRQHGQRRALLQNDTLAFDAYIRIVDDPTHSLWWHPSDFEPMWDSLGLTGYRPLGASTIGRSAEVAGLASWLNIAPFCKIIQNVDILEHLTNCDAKPKPLCDALQKFLWEWRGCEEPMDYISIDGISTTLQNLLESSSDVCEFWERLRRTIELELAGTEAVKELAELFDSPPADELRHLSGPVHTLPNAFNSRICVRAEQVKSTREALEGYLSAKPGRWLLPPILHLELSRQKLDVLAQQWRLVYDRVDLDEEVDLTPWVPQGQCASYVLYGYIVHRGPRASGKFFSVLRPAGPGTKWLAFDDGSDNRLDCLTRKTALQSYVGVSPSQTVDHKVGHDVAVAVMYVRSDVVREILPGPQDRWDATEFMRKYYEHGTHLILKAPDEASAKQLVQVEVYALPKYDGLGSLFDTYDLMSHAKATDNVMYLKFPRSASMSEVRKSIASCMSADGNQIHPEHVRLWEIGHARELFGAILSFRRIADLNATLHQPMDTIRFWMQVVSDADAEHFAMSDPQELNAPEDKREDTTADDGSESSDSQSSTEDEDDSNHASTPPVEPNVTRTSSAGNASYTLETAQPPAVTREPDPSAGDVLPEVSNNDAATAVMVADDVERMDAEEEQRWDEPVEGEQNESDADEAMELAHTGASKTQLPVRHAYYFIQLFDIEGQCLRTVGSYFSRLEESAKSVLRRHLNWPEDKDFLVWIRVDGSTAAPVRPGEALENFFVMDGTCFIVQEKLSKQHLTELQVSGKFVRPDLLLGYLWSKSRNHPVRSFTGFKTVEATFTGDYYSGEFKNGHYHGKGRHISDSASTYQGDFVFGKRHGKGVMVYPSGDTYDGDWVDDRRHGHGTFVERKTGNKYVGGYKDGKRHGKGVSYWEVADEEMDLCQICYGEEQDALFYDCGHVCACVPCARQVDICPICRKNVIGVVRIYRT